MLTSLRRELSKTEFLYQLIQSIADRFFFLLIKMKYSNRVISYVPKIFWRIVVIVDEGIDNNSMLIFLPLYSLLSSLLNFWWKHGSIDSQISNYQGASPLEDNFYEAASVNGQKCEGAKTLLFADLFWAHLRVQPTAHQILNRFNVLLWTELHPNEKI